MWGHYSIYFKTVMMSRIIEVVFNKFIQFRPSTYELFQNHIKLWESPLGEKFDWCMFDVPVLFIGDNMWYGLNL